MVTALHLTSEEVIEWSDGRGTEPEKEAAKYHR